MIYTNSCILFPFIFLQGIKKDFGEKKSLIKVKMRSPFAKPGRPLCKMERCEKLAEPPSPKKPPARAESPTRPTPACVKAITFSSCEDLSSLNKENQEDSLSCSLLSPGEPEGPGSLGCSLLSAGEPQGRASLGLQEDSGYASPQAGRSTPGGSGVPGGASPAEPRLPVLLFQRAVCRELSRAYGKTRSLDWGLVHSLAGQFGLHHVIGGKMGLEHVDVLQELLRRDMRHILSRVLLLLDDTDLVRYLHPPGSVARGLPMSGALAVYHLHVNAHFHFAFEAVL